MRAAAKKLGVTYPVVQDNDFLIWKRYGVWAWPTLFLIDKQGNLRYSRVGEGANEKTASVIEQLLSEETR